MPQKPSCCFFFTTASALQTWACTVHTCMHSKMHAVKASAAYPHVRRILTFEARCTCPKQHARPKKQQNHFSRTHSLAASLSRHPSLSISLMHSFAHSLAQLLAHTSTRSRTFSLALALSRTHSLTYSLTHSLAHSLNQ